MQVAVVGAGMAGLVAARALQTAGHTVAVLDKGRGVGGRMATRDAAQGGFDHGAQRFGARSEAFRAQLADWEARGLAAPTEATADDAAGSGGFWLGVPSINALARDLAAGLEIRTSTRVTAITRARHAYRLAIEGGREERAFDVVVITAPAPQTAALLAPHEVFANDLARVRYAPCWALCLLASPEGTRPPEAIFTELAEHPVIALIAREGKKPGRASDGEDLIRLVVHATTAFSIAHLEESEVVVASRMLEALRTVPGLEKLRARGVRAHRWRYARVTEPVGVPALFDADRGLGVAGDGLLGPRIEAAFESGAALASAILSR